MTSIQISTLKHKIIVSIWQAGKEKVEYFKSILLYSLSKKMYYLIQSLSFSVAETLNIFSLNFFALFKLQYTGRLTQLLLNLLRTSLSVQKVWGSIPVPVKLDALSPATRPRCDVSSELCCPDAKLRR